MNAAKARRLILSIHDSNMAGDSWRWNFHLERKAGGTHTLSCEQIFEDEPLVIDPVDDLRDGADIYEALCSILSNCSYHLGDQDISAIAEKIAKLDVAIAKQFSEPSEPAIMSAQERDFYRRIGGGPSFGLDRREKVRRSNGQKNSILLWRQFLIMKIARYWWGLPTQPVRGNGPLPYPPLPGPRCLSVIRSKCR